MGAKKTAATASARDSMVVAPVAIPATPAQSPDTRQSLMQLLKLHGERDVVSLARDLGISNVAVRQHLATLQGAGLVGMRTERRPMGRPAQLYHLTSAAESSFPQSSDRIALDLLARMEKMLGAEALDKLFQARLKDLSREYSQRLAGAATWAEKLKILAEIRDSEGYLCQVEPSSAAPGAALRLVEHHCPVAAIARQHPQVCALELELFRRVLGEPTLKRTEHILSGKHACAYERDGQNTK